MKTRQKVLGAVLCLVLLLSQASWALAAGEQSVSKDENVFILLNPDGSVQSQTVSCWLHSDEGFDHYTDVSRLSGLTNLKSDTQPAVNGEQVTWTTQEKDLYYQGTAHQTPPVSAAITYELDGQAVTADQLMGKSGTVTLHIQLTNQEAQQKLIGGQTRTVYTPFAVAVVLDLPVEHFTNIQAEHTQVLTEAHNQIVTFMALPGLKDSFEGLLDGELQGLKDRLNDEITVQFEAQDFQMPEIMMAVAPSVDELQDMDVSGQMTDLLDGMQQLQDASGQLQQGTDLLSQALSQYDTQMGTFKSQYQTFDGGVATALSGATQIQEGAQSLKGAAKLLKTKVTDELIPAMNQAAPLQQQLSDKMGSLERQLEDLEIPDLSGIQGQLDTALGTVCDATANATIQVLTGGAQTFQDLTPEQQAALSQAKAQILQQATTQVSGMLSGIDLGSLQTLKQTLLDIDDLAGQVMEGMDGLTQALYNPDDDPNNPQTLATAIMALSVGTDQLSTGADGLKLGLGDLRGASKVIGGAIDSFSTASGELDTKGGELDAGMAAFVEEGLSQITDPKLREEMQTALEIQKEMRAQTEAYTSYAGAADGQKTTHKWVYKVQAPEIPVEAQQQGSPALQEEVKPMTFWQRILHLFD